MSDKLVEELFDEIIADDAKRAQEKAIKEAAEQKEYEAKKQAEIKAREKEKLERDLIVALRDDDVAKAKQALEQGAEGHTNLIHSLEMADLYLSRCDLNTPEGKNSAEEIIASAVNNDEKSVDKYIAKAKDNGLSLDNILQAVASKKGIEITEKFIEAGAHLSDENFNDFLQQYYREKNGYYRGGYYEFVFVEGEPEKAAKTKEFLVSLIKSGHIKLDKENESHYAFAKELAYERAFESFSEHDKKLIADLKSDNIDEIRKAIDGKIPDNVEQYMNFVPTSEQGKFYQYYEKVMNYEKVMKYPVGNKQDAKPHNFADLEKEFIKHMLLDQAIEIARFKAEGIENIVAYEFAKSDIDSRRSAGILSERFEKMTPECKEAVALKMASQLDERFSSLKVVDFNHYDMERLKLGLKMYDLSDGAGKEALRMMLLKFRTSGSNEERRAKAAYFKDALESVNRWGEWKEGKYIKDKEIQKDETIKAVSEVSYNPLSALSRHLKKHGIGE